MNPQPTTAQETARDARRAKSKRYSIRRPGMTSWADTNSLRHADALQREANDRAGYGHNIVDNLAALAKATPETERAL